MIDNDNLIVKTYNFNLKCVNHYSVNFKLKKFYEIICSNIDRMKEKYDIGTICLSLPCIVKGGIVLDWYYNSNLNRFNLKSALINEYHLNTIIQNDMQLTVIGESAEIRRNTKNIITVQFGHNGIGVGEMANGRLLEGNSGFAGEVGYINNLRKNIMGISYPAKIVRNAIVFLNPEVIVFYKSERKNQFKEIISKAIIDLPDYAVPRFEITDDYFESIVTGFISLINKYGFFKKTGKGK